MPYHAEPHSPPSPLVKQLKQKFDRLNDNNNSTGRPSLQSQVTSIKPRRVGINDDDGVYPLLPVCCFLFFLLFCLSTTYDFSNNFI